MLAVIADDITGASEIAGIGLRFGLKVNIITKPEALPDCDLLVYATDTRSMNEDEAIKISEEAIEKLSEWKISRFFKKTDSALRGHIVAELKALMRKSGFDKVLLIPQNPSRGRIISDGTYLIDGVPIDQTAFANDPEFPAKTSDVKEYLKGVAVINQDTKTLEKGITVANAAGSEDIAAYLEMANERTLFAGGADFFIEYLHRQGKTTKPTPGFEGLEDRDTIIICGSTANHALQDFDYFKRKAIRFCNMPLNVFDGGNPQAWIDEIVEIYRQNKSIVVAIGQPSKGGKEYAVRLRNVMAEVAMALVKKHTPHELVIEGGATAFAVLNRLNWTNFFLTNEITGGVVRMSLSGNPDIHITLKPGSYSWGDKIFG